MKVTIESRVGVTVEKGQVVVIFDEFPWLSIKLTEPETRSLIAALEGAAHKVAKENP